MTSERYTCSYARFRGGRRLFLKLFGFVGYIFLPYGPEYGQNLALNPSTRGRCPRTGTPGPRSPKCTRTRAPSRRRTRAGNRSALSRALRARFWPRNKRNYWKGRCFLKSAAPSVHQPSNPHLKTLSRLSQILDRCFSYFRVQLCSHRQYSGSDYLAPGQVTT